MIENRIIVGRYSTRSAAMGLTRAARSAGNSPASKPDTTRDRGRAQANGQIDVGVAEVGRVGEQGLHGCHDGDRRDQAQVP